jgi:hypothetical protein
MKKKNLLLAIILCVAAVFSAQAQFRLDVRAMVPFYNGVHIMDSTYSDAAQFAFFIPEVCAYWQFAADPVRFGLGLRLVSFFTLVNIITPDIWCELHLDPIVIRAALSGGVAGIIIPLASFVEFTAGPLIVPDVSVGIKLGEVFRLGVGGTVIMSLDYPDEYFFSVYAFARLTFTFGGEEQSDE